MSKIKIKLRDKKGVFHNYEQNWVPTRKLMESFEIDSQTYPTNKEYYEKTINFVASVFDDKQVTYDAIIDGVASNELDNFMEDFFSQMVGGTDPNLEPENE